MSDFGLVPKATENSVNFTTHFPIQKTIKIHQTNKNPNNCKLKGDFVSYSSGKCVLVISAWHYKNEDVVWTVTNNDTSQPHQETWNKGMTMIDGSYSFTDISRKVFDGLAGQSGRTFPAWPAMHCGGWLTECPLQPTACPEGHWGPLLLTDTFGLCLVKEIPREVPENLIWFARVERETSLANKYWCSGGGNTKSLYLDSNAGWIISELLAVLAGDLPCPLLTVHCGIAPLCVCAQGSVNLLPKPSPHAELWLHAGASICLSATKPRALSSTFHIIAC